MYKRLAILSAVVVTTLIAFGVVGYYAIAKWAEGLQGARMGEFAEVAEQVRLDVKRKLDQFIQQEQNRPYTDYLYYHVPGDQAAAQQQAVTLVRSPLAGRLDHGLAYGHFQVQRDGTVITPNDDLLQRQGANDLNFAIEGEVRHLADQVRTQLLPLMRTASSVRRVSEPGQSRPQDQDKTAQPPAVVPAKTEDETAIQEKLSQALKAQAGREGKDLIRSAKALSIESLQKSDQQTQVTQMDRQAVYENRVSNTNPAGRSYAPEASGLRRAATGDAAGQVRQSSPPGLLGVVPREGQHAGGIAGPQLQAAPSRIQAQQTGNRASPEWSGQGAAPRGLAQNEDSTVTVRAEPLVPVLVHGGGDPCSLFDGLVYMVRHVQVGDEHVLQGFRLDTARLKAEVEGSARSLCRDNMGFELSKAQSDQAAYAAILDFGFGDLVLNLMDRDPGWISQKVHWLYRWYFATIAVVLLAVGLALLGLWRGAWQQVQLMRQKDDFISAVSHELRTPLTSIRMYAEMLEKGWVTQPEKQGRYYGGIRQESERLSRLIANVLDFSRIQRGRKSYHFAMGDLNAVVGQVVEMMNPYASQHGFVVRTDLASLQEVAFDRDAVTQIVVNLLDNAVKFAHSSQDKTIWVRTRLEEGHALIEVEDHGPGVPRSERAKIFDEFYRMERESTRQTTGTGLGLALVRGFAQAHHGFVRVTEAQPQGAIFTVGLNASPC